MLIDGDMETGVGGCIRAGEPKFEIGENWLAQSGGQIGKIRGRFPRQTKRAGIRFHSRKANRPDCGRAWNAEIGQQRGECFQFRLMIGVRRAVLKWRQDERFCLWQSLCCGGKRGIFRLHPTQEGKRFRIIR